MIRSSLTKRLARNAAAAMGCLSAAHSAPREITFSQSAQVTEAYDFVEVTITASAPDAPNPFADVAILGRFSRSGQPEAMVDGFCDSPDGSVFRIRFMPSAPGNYSYSVTYQQGEFRKEHRGNFRTVNGNRRRSPHRSCLSFSLHLGGHR